jgi:hypothetical protein
MRSGRRHLVQFVGGDAPKTADVDVADLVDQAREATRARHVAEREAARLRSEVQSLKGALKTAARVLRPYNGERQ